MFSMFRVTSQSSYSTASPPSPPSHPGHSPPTAPAPSPFPSPSLSLPPSPAAAAASRTPEHYGEATCDNRSTSAAASCRSTQCDLGMESAAAVHRYGADPEGGSGGGTGAVEGSGNGTDPKSALQGQLDLSPWNSIHQQVDVSTHGQRSESCNPTAQNISGPDSDNPGEPSNTDSYAPEAQEVSPDVAKHVDSVDRDVAGSGTQEQGYPDSGLTLSGDRSALDLPVSGSPMSSPGVSCSSGTASPSNIVVQHSGDNPSESQGSPGSHSPPILHSGEGSPLDPCGDRWVFRKKIQSLVSNSQMPRVVAKTIGGHGNGGQINQAYEDNEGVETIVSMTTMPPAPTKDPKQVSRMQSWASSCSGVSRASSLDERACRICWVSDDKETCIQPCHCSGYSANVHASCLQKWLQVTGSNKCEICHYEYRTNRRMKPVREWRWRVGHNRHLTQLEATVILLGIVTPPLICGIVLCSQKIVEYMYTPEHAWKTAALMTLILVSTATYLAALVFFCRKCAVVCRSWITSNSQTSVWFGDVRRTLEMNPPTGVDDTPISGGDLALSRSGSERSRHSEGIAPPVEPAVIWAIA